MLVHGYTNCPEQFRSLGDRLFALGCNVLIAPLPHHGLLDRMNTDHQRLTAEELAAYADEVVDIANGLGRSVIMVGISAGGVTTAFAAQFRAELDRAVIISPAFGFQRIPSVLTAQAAGLFMALPNSFRWWNAENGSERAPLHSYPRYSTHALAQVLRLGSAVRKAAEQRPPLARSLVLVTNANDQDVNPVLMNEVRDAWQRHDALVRTFEFGAELRLAHDLIDPAQADQRIDLVYPRLLELILKD